VIFRNVHKLLADTASSEFLFCLDFWEDEPLFRELVAPIVGVVEGDLAEQLQVGWGWGWRVREGGALGLGLWARGGSAHARAVLRAGLETAPAAVVAATLLLGRPGRCHGCLAHPPPPTQDQWDAVGVLLMIRINAELRRLMSRRRVPCLDDYLDRVNLLLWPRFKVGCQRLPEGRAAQESSPGHRRRRAKAPSPQDALRERRFAAPMALAAGPEEATQPPALPPSQVLWDLQHASIKAGAERSLFTGEVAVCATTKRYAALTASVLRLMAHHDEEDGACGGAAEGRDTRTRCQDR
jgi:hypothetical protein